MERRKNPKKDLRKLSGLFFQIGLLAALALVVCAFEYRTPEVIKAVDIKAANFIEQPLIPITIHNPPPPPPKRKRVNPVEVVPHDPEPVAPEVVPVPEIMDIVPDIIPDLPVIEKAPEFYDYVEKMPAPVGGYEAFYKYISKNLKYPSRAKRLGIEGKVYVHFLVDENGKITEVKVIKGIGAGLDEEAKRVLSMAPNWVPGSQGGRKVKVRMIIPITFRLGN